MKTYLRITAVLFAAIVAVHLWRASLEGWHLLREPIFLGATVVSAGICGWAVMLLRRRGA